MGVVVGGVAVLQSLRLFGITRFLERYTSQGDTAALDIGRGSSLLGNSVATGFFMTAVVLVAVSMLLHRRWLSFPLAALCGVLVLGAMASGQFSGVLVLAVGLLVLGAVTGRLAEVVMFGTPTALVTGLLIWPVIATRLDGFESAEGLPSSWQVRWENLTQHVWPRLGDLNFVLGVRPSTRIAAPEVWRPWIYIENGHSYLLWAGGIPLLAAYLWLTVQGLRLTATDRHHPEPTFAATAAAVHALLWALTLAMVFDPHLTLRGSADLLFPLLALTGVASGRIHLILEGSSNDRTDRRYTWCPPSPPSDRPALSPSALRRFVAAAHGSSTALVASRPGSSRGPKSAAPIPSPLTPPVPGSLVPAGCRSRRPVPRPRWRGDHAGDGGTAAGHLPAGQARDRRGARRVGAGGPFPGAGGVRARCPGDQRRAGAVPPGTGRPRWDAVHAAQAADDDPRQRRPHPPRVRDLASGWGGARRATAPTSWLVTRASPRSGAICGPGPSTSCPS